MFFDIFEPYYLPLLTWNAYGVVSSVEVQVLTNNEKAMRKLVQWRSRQRKSLFDAIASNENYITNTMAYVTMIMILITVIYAAIRNEHNSIDLMRTGIVLCIVSQISGGVSCVVVNMIYRNIVTLIDNGVDDADIYKKVKSTILLSDWFNMVTVCMAVIGFLTSTAFIIANI